MSFSGKVKEELLKEHNNTGHHHTALHCVYAELAALILFEGGWKADDGHDDKEKTIFLNPENDFIRQKAFTLCKKTINIVMDRTESSLRLLPGFQQKLIEPDPETTLRRKCCRRAFLRGAFLCIGSMSDPGKSYHLEYDCIREEDARLLRDMIGTFGIEAKIVERKKYHVVYLKDGSAICDILNIMGAPVSLMDFENHRIVREVRNSVNRKVNCETANITKTVNAAGKQVQDILLIRETAGFAELPKHLRETAELRLQYPDATLQELGEMLTPPIGKSGVNHRLRKLSDIAAGIGKQ